MPACHRPEQAAIRGGVFNGAEIEGRAVEGIPDNRGVAGTVQRHRRGVIGESAVEARG